MKRVFEVLLDLVFAFLGSTFLTSARLVFVTGLLVASVCISDCSIGLVAILFYEVMTATFTVSDSVLTETVFSIS